ncbi:hypothetical protein WH47_04726 [Habropoda laboriosa]|uniref:Uncharacterized protein n=1 Tax=Habropoda laboriosa TaxID=597456 RepID=A0A0L7QXD4_9HYME|nr:hypothetical protein WH47_04726 [Habropoda laboriosa]
MSKEGNSEETPQEGAGGGETSKKDDIYETGRSKKIVRLITVMAYMFSVSFVAIVLSGYYLFLWEPPNPRLLRRPVHLLAEPEMERLSGDPPYAENELYKPQMLSGRTADKDNLADNYDSAKKREKMDESMFLLRHSLVEFLQNRVNDSKYYDEYITSKSRRASKFFNRTSLFAEREMSNSTDETNEKAVRRSSEILNRTFDNNSTTLTLNSSTISGDETNNNRLTSTRKNSMHPASPESVFESSRNFTQDTATNREKYKKIVFTGSKAKTETWNKKSVKTTGLRRSRENVETQRNRKDVEQEVHLNDQSTTLHSQHNFELADRPQHPDRSNESPTELANFALKFKGRETSYNFSVILES